MSATNPIFVFDHVRSNSQMFNKIFAAHPQLEQVFMPFIAASLYGPEAVFRGRRHSKTTDETFNSLANAAGIAESESYEVAIRRMEEAVSAIQGKGQTPWIKEHAFCVIPRAVQDSWTAGHAMSSAVQQNPTVLSTEFLDSVTPIFLIRHPALSVPSFLRKDMIVCKNQAGDEDFSVYTALYWSRLIFDSFVARAAGRNSGKGNVPVVVDAADVIYNTEPILRTLCERVGIEYDGVQTRWDPVPESAMPASPIFKTFFADLYRSSGVERRADRPSEDSLDLDAMQKQWSEEFGAESAADLRKLVDAETEHYEYLKKFKLMA